jgi:ATP-binding cassette, subfamily C, bacterial PrsD
VRPRLQMAPRRPGRATIYIGCGGEPGAARSGRGHRRRAGGRRSRSHHRPEGYETVVGDHGSALSAGQAQRIALARALYRDPFLVVLDEPNSNLDAEGDEALTRAILGLRARGAITVVVAHRPGAIAGVDYILVMAKGRQQQFGPKEEILNRVMPPSAAPRPLKVADQGGTG